MTNDVTNLRANKFTNLTANLVGGPGALTTQIRTITLFDASPGNAGDSIVLVGGLGGVFRYDSANKGWTKFGSALPNVLVKDLQFIDTDRIQLLPNTSGAATADEAVRTARLARTMGLPAWVKLEVTPDPRYLIPDAIETVLV